MSEAHEQAALISWARMMSAKDKRLARLYHTPNGGSRYPAEAANLRRQGVVPGVPDLALPYPAGGKHGLFIEMKYGRNKLTKPQREWIEYLSSVGYATAVCYSAEEAIDVIRKYLKDEE